MVKALLLAIAFFRTFTLSGGADESIEAAPIDDLIAIQAAARLGDAITIETISWGDGRSSEDAFVEFHDFLDDTYVEAHRVLERTIINGQSLIYRWRGTNVDAIPVALAAHMDVVPVEEGTEDAWDIPPFSGAVTEGRVWGRGALDDKGSIIAIFEAVESLIEKDFTPKRDVYFLFGHDEEIGGSDGAGAIVAHLKAKGVQFEWALDEGSAPVKGLIPGYDGVAALISLGEKGSTSLELKVQAEGGHSSAPGRDTAASIVARAAAKIADNPYPAKLDKTTSVFLRALAPELPFAQRFALANLWLMSPLVKAQKAGLLVEAS